MAANRAILLLDCNEKSASDIQRFLKVSAFAFNLSHASGIEDGADYLKSRQPDLVLLDAAYADLPNYSLVRSLLETHKVPTILLSEATGGELKKQAERAGAQDYLLKNKVNLFSLQKIIVNTLKLNETESRLDNAFEEYTARQESFSLILNRVGEGIMIINPDNLIRFANDKAYSILGDEKVRRLVSDFIQYRRVEEEETVELKSNGRSLLTVRVSPIQWGGENANLVILEKIHSPAEGTTPQGVLPLLTPLLDHVEVSMVLLKNNQIVFANKQAAHYLLLRQSEIAGRRLNDVFGSDEELISSSSLQTFMAEKKGTGLIKAADGSTRQVSFTLRYLNIDGELLQLMWFTVVEPTAESEAPRGRTDGGADGFSTDDVLHLASHDLREPVRTILNYVQLISDHLAKEKYTDAAEYATYAREAATRMDQLLSDLKVYIALNEYAFTMNKVSLKMLTADILKNLSSEIEQRGATVTVAPNLPDISADRELVEKLLTHLVVNAMKFTRKGNKPVVDIGFDKFEGNIIFCVRDNGIGISKKYQEKVFELFERLNRVDEYPGNGLGLAICKKIVEMHGGKIWVESLPGAGSSFYFTLRR